MVSGAKLARHFGCIAQNIDYLAQKGIIERRADGLFDQDVSRLKYLDHLRAEHRRSPRSEADAAHAKVKTEILQLHLMEKRRELVRMDEVTAMIDTMMGVVLTALSSMSARCAPRGDLATRRAIERCVFEVRIEIADIAQKKADEYGEPPLDEQE